MNSFKIFYYSEPVIKKVNNDYYKKLFPGNIQLEMITAIELTEIKDWLNEWKKKNELALIVGIQLNDLFIPYTESILDNLKHSKFYYPTHFHPTLITLFLITQLSYYKLSCYTNYYNMQVSKLLQFKKIKRLI
jgi:hypothetical protein